MFVVRPAQLSDIAALESLASTVMEGVHTLPRARDAITAAVERSLASFAAEPDLPGEEAYIFVLEGEDGQLAGSAALTAQAGENGLFFAFRNDVIQQVSRDLKMRHSVHALTLCSDLTGHSQLLSFYLRDCRRAGLEAALLSRARLLFAATCPQRFGERFFTSLAGVSDAHGRSPFWDALGRKFFQMNFLEAERAIAGARNRTLLVELMPHYPVYVPLLPAEARSVMGQVHREAELPLALLTREGFEPDEFIDIFDGGPILRAHKMALRSFSSSVPRVVKAGAQAGHGRRVPYLVSAMGESFRAVLLECDQMALGEAIALDDPARRALGVAAGDTVLTVEL